MADHEYHERWVWELQASPEQLWPLVADTNRFDRDSGVPAADLVTDGELLGDRRVRVRVRQYGVTLDYVQDPFVWDEPRRFGVTRHFSSGPIGRLRILAELDERHDGGTTLTYQVWATRRNALGLSIPIQIGQILRRRFDKAFRTFDALAVAGTPELASGSTPTLARTADERIAAARAGLTGVPGGSSVDPALLDRLADHLRRADDVAVARLRPYALADRWGLPRRDVLEAALVATRLGLLRFRWDVLCPQCRIAKATDDHLVEVPTAIHCDACGIDTTANLARNVELTFAPAPTVRLVDPDEYCIGNPAATPHVVHQGLLAPGETATVVPPEPGRYRVRCLERPGAITATVADDGATDVPTVSVPIVAEATADVAAVPGATIPVRNAGADEVLVLVERAAWGDDAVTGAEVIALQRFRDLFADEALRPGERIEVGTTTIVFTDLCDSTALYQRIGDAVAFGRVLDHFDVLRRCIDAAGGSIVKTIGDAVMAAFARPERAVEAMVAAQTALARASDGASGDRSDEPLRLKAGIHSGPCIAVTLNGRLDYFGSTVNLAARLEGCATGGDIVMSDAVHDDPAVTALLAAEAIAAVADDAELKGFGGSRRIWRLTPAAAASSGSTT